ncbi:ribosome biogenesis GTPase YlqF [Desulfallas thermosapovorans]|uniref:Ribosome biogenesis GTPase A n=1 Tax=Desulfallas thermosapovorans DSM 6562 TaxID=1121431 RepID=A0A5S4ZR52_9FIRM|nr:ribosome biogenesis GTPase YlqF [Desulfallas thermosapovorans]TYO95180.1 ribosome biogenesis GTPase A [Desulfallas thermosapovorans DSM 6562]
MDIQWYPGHMAKARRQVQQNLQMVDVAIELLDARIPASSRNPDINVILKGKPRLVVLNKSDLADASITAAWLNYFARAGYPAVAVDAHHGAGIKKMIALAEQLARPAIKKYMARGRLARLARCMVVGVPNVGKSMLINRLAGKKAARTGNRPGVTRGEQWIKLGGKLELLDTPGILWPKFEDPETAYKLAVTGAIKEQIYNPEEVCEKLVQWLVGKAPDTLAKRYKLSALPEETWEVIERIGVHRGFYLSGGKIDSYKTATFIIKEFREGKLGRCSLETPGNQ